VFEHFTPDGLAWALGEALAAWEDRDAWAALVRNGMAERFSWSEQVKKYELLYDRLLR
jgi:glycogen synthase